jgi:hypothetical protein
MECICFYCKKELPNNALFLETTAMDPRFAWREKDKNKWLLASSGSTIVVSACRNCGTNMEPLVSLSDVLEKVGRTVKAGMQRVASQNLVLNSDFLGEG